MRLMYWLLFSIYAANYLDRQVFSVLLEAIRKDLSLGDLEMGLLSGLTFSVAYGAASIPAAIWASAGNRRNLISVSALIWGGATVLAGFASNFVQLFLARAVIAAAEATSIPASHSILSDGTQTGGRVKLFGQFVSGSAVGGLLAVFFGGFVGHQFGWRVALVCAGFVGIIPGILLFFLTSEPKRDYGGAHSAKAGKFAILQTTIKAIFGNRRSRMAFTAETINQIVLASAVSWYPTFLVRSHGFSQIEAAATASFGGLLAIAGTIITSKVLARLSNRNRVWLTRGPAITVLVGKPFSVIFLLADQPLFALAAFIVPAALSLSTYPPTFSLLHETVSPEERPIASAMLLSLATVVGLGIGPTMVGLLSAGIGGPYSLTTALLCTQAIGLTAAAIYWFAPEPRA
ncbi:MFS transporter [Rhizobium sp. L1K21]|uniref:MFS transporter n=1 Tax=Rhizobium sp. L1K21 TaxID=2954933 RepID=UPI0020937AEF|nr:MFS transporter [Rhizobium sp. L1K21]MCO6187033.1 MFS transporter [Rhizobium sp. L1K21]